MFPCKERFFVARCHLLAALYECEQTVRNLSKKSRFLAMYLAARRRASCSRTFASTLVTLQICALIIVVGVDLVTLASLSHVKKSGSIQY